MEKPIEMIMAFSIFLLAFSITYTISNGLYIAGINSHLSKFYSYYAESLASTIVLINGNSSSLWKNWIPQNYIKITSSWDFKFKIIIRTTCFKLNEDKIEIIWIKENELFSSKVIGKAYRFIILDDGTALKLEVFIIV
ncbi:MAG: hypothetical protein QE159_06075 [Candidatus Verstraetearchaeota archaeon]|nr:hypothetical protein [Candidatus Verstraetearchaeota archaeon]